MNRTTSAAFALLLCCGFLHGQTTTGGRDPMLDRTYVRRISIGPTLTVLALPLISNRTINQVTTSPAVDGLYTTTNVHRRIGYGLTVQGLITDRFALNARLLVRKLSYRMGSDIYTGTDNPSTDTDERINTVRNEDTRATLFELPVVIRYYGKDRKEPGPRWFVDVGAALRRVSQIKTSIDETIEGGTTTCCDTTPARPRYRTVRGMVGGFGVQLIDPVGIRVVPEVRYTRWIGASFNSLSTLTRRDQVEAVLSLTF